jgi:hypothetical protein
MKKKGKNYKTFVWEFKNVKFIKVLKNGEKRNEL